MWEAGDDVRKRMIDEQGLNRRFLVGLAAASVLGIAGALSDVPSENVWRKIALQTSLVSSVFSLIIGVALLFTRERILRRTYHHTNSTAKMLNTDHPEAQKLWQEDAGKMPTVRPLRWLALVLVGGLLIATLSFAAAFW